MYHKNGNKIVYLVWCEDDMNSLWNYGFSSQAEVKRRPWPDSRVQQMVLLQVLLHRFMSCLSFQMCLLFSILPVSHMIQSTISKNKR